MKLFVFSCALLLAAPAAGLCADAQPSSQDATFVQTAQHYALGDYALASLGRSKASNPATKALAVKLLANSDRASRFIATYAKAHDVKVDGKPAILADEQYGQIKSDTGTSFDQAFAGAVHMDAAIALDSYQNEVQNGTDPALKTFAKDQTVLLQTISANAQSIQH